MKLSKSVIVTSLAAFVSGGLMINSASAVESVGWKTSNPHRTEVFDAYQATRSKMSAPGGQVSVHTSNPHRTEVYNAYEATRQADPDSGQQISINTSNPHRSDVYDIYAK
ncbi:MAG: hypothetical protein JSW48_13685 [Betaproteobacteria bacterium]|jgi:hypothetical protein|nr:MAG: hypothetical protein JSW48_13685 [Betaproteobacteria bacterium]